MENVSGLIEQYFLLGYTYNEILYALSSLHKVSTSIRSVHRYLRKKGLYRKGISSQTSEVIAFVENELNGSFSSAGYRQIHQLCRREGFQVSRNKVALIVRELDPEGVECRRKKYLKRRLYFARGPNWVWHIDGYDKLMPYGFSLHGAIDGFSRRIMWLHTLRSNKNPKEVCCLYLNTIRCTGVPRKVVGDKGYENVNIAASQRFFRRNENDSSAGYNSFRYGKSISNQRIEAL